MLPPTRSRATASNYETLFLQGEQTFYNSTSLSLHRRARQMGSTCWFIAFLSLLHALDIIDRNIDRYKAFLESIDLNYDKAKLTVWTQRTVGGRLRIVIPPIEYALYGPTWQRIVMAYVFFHWKKSVSLKGSINHANIDSLFTELLHILQIPRSLRKGTTITISSAMNFDTIAHRINSCYNANDKTPYFLINLTGYVVIIPDPEDPGDEEKAEKRPIAHDVVGSYGGMMNNRVYGQYMLFHMYDQSHRRDHHYAIFRNSGLETVWEITFMNERNNILQKIYTGLKISYLIAYYS